MDGKKVCPQCGFAYEPHVTTCADCQVALVDKLEAPPVEDRGNLVSVYRAPDQTSLLWAQSALQQEGIKAFVRSFEVPAYDDVFVHPSGAWGELLVAEDDLSRATELLEALATADIVPPEEAEQEPGP